MDTLETVDEDQQVYNETANKELGEWLQGDDDHVEIEDGDTEREAARSRGHLAELRMMREFNLCFAMPRHEAIKKGIRIMKYRWVDKERPEEWRC